MHGYANTEVATPFLVRDRRTRYRARPKRQTTPPPLIDARASEYDTAARWQHITELNTRLQETLDEQGRALWLALEEALHVHWLDVAVAHYNRGYAAGRAQAWADEVLADADSLQDKLQAISLALSAVIETLETPRKSS